MMKPIPSRMVGKEMSALWFHFDNTTSPARRNHAGGSRWEIEIEHRHMTGIMTQGDDAAASHAARGPVIRSKPKHTVPSAPYPLMCIDGLIWSQSSGERSTDGDEVKGCPICVEAPTVRFDMRPIDGEREPLDKGSNFDRL
jgi:hypothetical protein